MQRRRGRLGYRYDIIRTGQGSNDRTADSGRGVYQDDIRPQPGAGFCRIFPYFGHNFAGGQFAELKLGGD